MGLLEQNLKVAYGTADFETGNILIIKLCVLLYSVIIYVSISVFYTVVLSLYINM